MMSFQSIYGQVQSLCNDSASGTLTLIKSFINQTQENILALRKDITESSATDITRSDQTNYYLPYDYGKMFFVTITVGGVAYHLKSIEDDNLWRDLQARATGVTSDIPSFYHIFNNQMFVYPTPASSDNTITYYYHKITKRMSVDDYTTGKAASVPYSTTFTAIVAAAAVSATLSAVWPLATGSYVITFSNGEKRTVTLTSSSAAVTWTTGLTAAATATITIGNSIGGSIVSGASGGDAPVWAATMVGRYINITSDNYWYKIYNYIDATHLGLERVFAGTAISAALEAFTVGEMSLLPEAYSELLIWRPTALYYQQKGEMAKAKFYWDLYREMERKFIEDRGSKTESAIISGDIARLKQGVGLRNPQNYPLGLS